MAGHEPSNQPVAPGERTSTPFPAFPAGRASKRGMGVVAGPSSTAPSWPRKRLPSAGQRTEPPLGSGAHMAYVRGVGVSNTAFDELITEWTPLAMEAALGDGWTEASVHRLRVLTGG